MHWVTVDGLEQHWERARVDAEIPAERPCDVDDRERHGPDAVDAPGDCPLDPDRHADASRSTAQKLTAAPVHDRPLVDAHFRKIERRLDSRAQQRRPDAAQAARPARPDRRRLHGQLHHGPPHRQPLNDKVGAWADAEMDHAIEHWRQQFRGEAPVQGRHRRHRRRHRRAATWSSGAIRAATRVLAKIADKLPIRWDAQGRAARRQASTRRPPRRRC